MYTRLIEPHILAALQKYRAVAIVGPRQSGKTTLSRKLFPNADYWSLETPDIRERAQSDPRSLLVSSKEIVIFDEIQRVPSLISYLQEILDDPTDHRRFVLTGSNSLTLSDQIAQSLAGRIRIFDVLPLSYGEIPPELRPQTISEAAWKGGFPRIYHRGLEPMEWLSSYHQTYVEKDVRQILNIDNLGAFDRLLRLTAGRVGQLMNYASLGGDAGVTQPTAARWISLLQTSFLVFLLQPHFRNFNKQVIKSPKLYFYDTGLLCYLLRIQNASQIDSHPLRGALFENWVISEAFKKYVNAGQKPPLYFWRDEHGHEIDLVVDRGIDLYLVEIKSGMTYQSEFSKSIVWLNKLQGKSQGSVVYGGSDSYESDQIKVIGWKDWGNALSIPVG